MKLSEIIEEYKDTLVLVNGDAGIEIESIEYDSRKVKKGSLFVAVEGLTDDGHNFINKAVDSGASAVIINKLRLQQVLENLKQENISVITADDSRRALSYVSDKFTGFVSRTVPVIGVTGTNGKTSITYMLESIFSFAGKKVGVMGTINYRWPGKLKEAPNTTPESKDIFDIMEEMKRDGVDIIVMEVSSHGLSMGRVEDIQFTGALFTNLTRDHLDYHRTFEDYFNAKKHLFYLLEKSRRKDKFALINLDDPYGEKLYNELKNNKFFKTVSSSINDRAYFHPVSGYRMDINGINYQIDFQGEKADINLHVSGKFSLYNSIMACGAAFMSGAGAIAVSEGISSLKNVPGRFDKISSNTGINVLVDYAHTNDALEKLLSSAKELTEKRLITVFGCGGDRDKTKRPIMGEIAVRYSDFSIVTSDNPRTEDPAAIINDILSGIDEKEKDKYSVEPDRDKAIGMAINMAEKGDLVVLAGKGHEDYQIIGKTKTHFDDKEVARKYISIREKL